MLAVMVNYALCRLCALCIAVAAVLGGSILKINELEKWRYRVLVVECVFFVTTLEDSLCCWMINTTQNVPMLALLKKWELYTTLHLSVFGLIFLPSLVYALEETQLPWQVGGVFSLLGTHLPCWFPYFTFMSCKSMVWFMYLSWFLGMLMLVLVYFYIAKFVRRRKWIISCLWTSLEPMFKW